MDALVPMQKAAALSPNDAEVHNNLGVLLQAQGRLEAALASLRRALELKPDYANAHNSLGSILDDLGQFEAAQASYRRALELNPDFADAHNNMGVALKDQGQFAAAAASLRRAIELKPDYAEAHNNLGIVLNAQGQFDAAQASCRRALELNPNYAEAHYSLGCVLKEQGQFDAARASYCRALELNPDYADAHYSLGVVLNAQGQLDAARASYRRALELNPGHAEAHNNLGIIQMEQGQLDDAQASFRHALDIKPNYFECYSNLLFCGNYDINLAREESFDLAKCFGALVAGKAKPFKEWNVLAEPRRRIRVGVVSGDLRKHSVSYFLGSVLDNLDKNQIELIAYPTQVKTDAVTDRLRRHFSQWSPLTDCSDEDAAQRIYGDRVDILLDLSGHTAKNRLPIFAWRPAPIQVSWLGYFATTGMAEMDYLLADKVGVPASELEQFTESVWYLPNTRMCFTAPEVAIPVAPLPALANGNITFGCFQTATKVNDSVLAVWGKIFAELPDAKLRMQCNKLGEPAQEKQMLQRLQRYGIDPARVLVRGTTSREAYLAAHAEVDIILDTFPFTGGTTTSEALWMGVPTLTLAGSSLLARQGASLLTAAGLEEWVAVDEEEYITKAVSYGRNLERLSELRRCLRAKVLASPLFDAPLFAKDFEAALRGMWQVWCEKQRVHTT
ncbi:MAG: tetratricopeptide repeat protein [Gallionella sp.]|nr:tetratricopeptide repeat protein [Gallionella sp.]